MTGLRRNLVMGGIGAVLTVGALVEAGFLLTTLKAARVAARDFARRQDDWRSLVSSGPAVTERGALAADADLRGAEAALAEAWPALERWCEPALLWEKRPAASQSGIDAFFALAGFVRSMREQAGRAGVSLRADEQFGFSAYSHEGPAGELAAMVDAQRRTVGRLLEILWTTKPRQLEAVQRTPPRQAAARAAPGRLAHEAPASGREDLFEMDSNLSVGTPRLVTADAFRITFVGQTVALRRFLDGIVTGDFPLVVRSVSVEPVKELLQRRGGGAAGRDPLVMVLRPGLSRFIVTVESFALTAPLGPASAQNEGLAGGLPAPGRWPDPAPQRRGPGWVYDLFTPPSLYYDAERHALSAGRGTVAPAGADARFDLELLAVERAPFRWRLVGYTAGKECVRGIFADAETGETVIAGPGAHLGGPDWTVKRVALERTGPGGDDASTPDPVAMAAVVEEATGVELLLTGQGPCLAGAPLGLFTSRKDPAFRCGLQEGQSVALNGAEYCVERLDPRDAQAVVARVVPGVGEPVILTLTPSPVATVAAEAPGRQRPEQSTRLSLTP